jgi:hypothetical protein
MTKVQRLIFGFFGICDLGFDIWSWLSEIARVWYNYGQYALLCAVQLETSPEELNSLVLRVRLCMFHHYVFLPLAGPRTFQ